MADGLYSKSVNTFRFAWAARKRVSLKSNSIRRKNLESFAQVFTSNYPRFGKYENGNTCELNTDMYFYIGKMGRHIHDSNPNVACVHVRFNLFQRYGIVVDFIFPMNSSHERSKM